MKQSVLIISARERLLEAKSDVVRAEKAFAALQDQKTVYAKEIKRIADGYREIVKIWERILREAGENV